MSELTRRAVDALAERQREHRLRRRGVVERTADARIVIDGRSLIDVASNDYLGLTHHPAVIAAMATAAATHGVGSGASALVSGYTSAHQSVERIIADWKSTEASVLLASGFAANAAAIQTLAVVAGGGGVRFLIDKLIHASLVDAVRAADSAYRVFPHNHLGKLRRLLESAPSDQMQVVVTESIFSMDGDAADLHGLAELKKEFKFTLLLDEAHGSGVFGPNGAGYAAELGLQSIVDVTVVTLSKALGVAGGAMCASMAFCEAVVNFARPYIYSTNVPPPLAAAIQAAVEVVHREPHRRERLRSITKCVRDELAALNVAVVPGIAPIIPVVIGDEARCLAAAESLRELGVFTVAIRPPTVPIGSSRLRITLSSAMSDDDVTTLIRAIASVV